MECVKNADVAKEIKRIMLNMKETVTAFLKQGIGSLEDENKLEEFFQLVAQLEQKAADDPQYYALLTDAYLAVGYTQKAKDAFSKIYNPKNKKDIKKMLNIEHTKSKPIVQPSKRAKSLPQFRYVNSQILKNHFIESDENQCSICAKTAVPLYIGRAYSETEDEILLLNQKEQFCAACLYSGAAADKTGLAFNSPYLEQCSAAAEDFIRELEYRTPECTSLFDDNEEIWQICCGDFCRLERIDSTAEEKFYFQCLHCKKEIVWTKMT